MASATPEISNLVSKLSSPQFIHRNRLPTFRQTCVYPSTVTASSISKESAFHTAQSISWSRFDAATNAATSDRLPTTFSAFYQQVSPNRIPRLVFFGEQHHQPSVLKTQLQAMHDFQRLCQNGSHDLAYNHTDDTKSDRKAYRLNLVLEHFSLMSQASLSRFQSGEIDFAELNEDYSASKEGFDLQHYAPLLLLARELNVKIWAGFPERALAKRMMKEGLDSVKELESQRIKEGHSVAHDRISGFDAWDQVINLGSDHRCFLKSLMNPDKAGIFPALEHGQNQSQESRPTSPYPTSQIPKPSPETKGFSPAQALKDSYFAHVVSKVLTRGEKHRSQKTPTAASDSDVPSRNRGTEVNGSEDVEVIDTVFAVCGSGHCEYGFGAPERSHANLAGIDPIIIISKPKDSELWLGPEWEKRVGPQDELCNEKDRPRWTRDGWDSKLADLVVLYDWED